MLPENGQMLPDDQSGLHAVVCRHHCRVRAVSLESDSCHTTSSLALHLLAALLHESLSLAQLDLCTACAWSIGMFMHWKQLRLAVLAFRCELYLITKASLGWSVSKHDASLAYHWFPLYVLRRIVERERWSFASVDCCLGKLHRYMLPNFVTVLCSQDRSLASHQEISGSEFRI